MICRSIISEDFIKKIRKTQNQGELLKVLREEVDSQFISSVDLILYSSDLGAFHFPADTEGDGIIFRNALSQLNVNDENIEISLWKDRLTLLIKEETQDSFQLTPLSFNDCFLGFLLILHKESDNKDDFLQNYMDTAAFLCEETLYLQIQEQSIEKLTLENQMYKNSIEQSENLKIIGEMMGGITHDFNNIFTGVIGYSQLIKMMTKEEETKDSIMEILQAAENGRKRIGFLQETKKINPEELKQEIDLCKITKEVIGSMEYLTRSIIPEKTPEEIFLLKTSQLSPLMFPPVHFKQLLMQIFTSLIKHGADSVEIVPSEKDNLILLDISFSLHAKQFGVLPIDSPSSSSFPDSLIITHLADRFSVDFELEPCRILLKFYKEKPAINKAKLLQFKNTKALVFEPDPVLAKMYASFFNLLTIQADLFTLHNDFINTLKKSQSQYQLIIMDVSAYPAFCAWETETEKDKSSSSVILTSAWGPLLKTHELDMNRIKGVLPKPFNFESLLRMLVK